MRTVELKRDYRVSCPWHGTRACDAVEPSSERCQSCDRYAELLESVREIYGDRAWAVTPDGVLQEVG